MKIKHTLIAIGLGNLVIIIGAFVKINHHPSASLFLAVGLVLCFGGILTFLYKLSTHPKIKEFLNF